MFTRKYPLCAGKLPTISPPPPAPAFRIGMPPLPAFFLLLLLLAGFVPPAVAQEPPTVSLQPGGMLTRMGHILPPTEVYFDVDGIRNAGDIAVSGDLLFVAAFGEDALSVWRVNAETGILSQTAVYRNGGRDDAGTTIGSLLGANGIAFNGDGDLLFVTAGSSVAGTLSVWRVNASSGTLSQTVVYQNNEEEEIGGLTGVRGVAVGGDGDLLFVTAQSNDALSVWRVNAEAGTLSQTVVYQNGNTDDAGKIINGLNGARGIAVSDDGELLFVTAVFDDALSVWRVNASSGTLSQTALYEDDMRGIDGLNAATNIAVSGDGELLFVAAFDDNALSVWRVNASSGTLSQVVVYRNGSRDDAGKRIDGLFRANDVAVSGDGALLFVKSNNSLNSALSVWRVNASSGTLSQTAVYRNGRMDDAGERINGLNGAGSVTASGVLLFVTAELDNALSAWQINSAEVSLEVPTVIRVQSELPVAEEVMVTVTARKGADSVAARPVTLSPSTMSADATFPPGALIPGGRWIFTAQASPPTALDTGAARIAMQVLPPLLSLEPQQKQFALGTTVALTVRTIAGLPAAASFTIDAINTAVALEGSTPTITVEYPASATGQEVFFPAQDIAMFGLGRLDFFIRLPDNSPFRVGDDPAATVQIVTPQLRLVPLQQQFALGTTVILTVRAEAAAPVNTTYDIIALRTASAQTSFTRTVEHPAGATEQEVFFPARQIASLGQWEFSISPLPPGSPFQVGDGSTATVQIVNPQLQLVPLQKQFALGTTVILTVRAEAGALTEATYDIIARHLALATTFSIEVIHPAGVTAQEVPFPALQITSPGQWEFSIRLPEGSPFQVIANGTATVYVAPVLSLRLQGEFFSAGNSLNIEVRADSPPAVAAAVTITAQRQQDGVEVNAAEAVMLSPEVLSGQAVFSAGALGDGEWVFTAQSEPPQALYTANARAEATVLPPPLMLEVSAPPSVTVGNTFTVTVGAAAGTPPLESVSVTATVSLRAGNGEEIDMAEVVLTPALSLDTLSFTAPLRAGIFRVEVSGRAVIGASASVTVVPVAVMLQLSAPDAVPVRQDYQVTVDTNMPVPAGTTLEVTVSDGTEPQKVSLTAANPSEGVPFTAPLNVGEVMVAATVEVQTAADAREVAVAAAMTQTVQVLPEGTVALTLDAPLDVTVGDTFTVTVGVSEETPLPESVSVTATISLRAANGDERERKEVVLTSASSSVRTAFTAPVTAGLFSVEVSGREEAASIDEVAGTSAQVSVEAVAVRLQLSGPATVLVGQGYQVTVDTVMPVPEGTALTVTVTASAGTDIQVQVVSLTAANSEDIPFTAPRTAGAVMVTAMVEVQTAADAREVAVPDAATLAVTVSAQDVQLVLSEFPLDLVAAGSTFTVTVGTALGLPEGAAVMVTVSLAAFSSEPVTLMPSAPTASVIVTAPPAGGAVLLRATGETAADSTLELNVLAAEAATVQVREQVSLSLRLEAPPEVTARDSFAVTVFTEPEVPGGATVTVTVAFDGTGSSTVALNAEMSSTAVMFTAPSRIENDLELMTSSVVTVAEPNVLRVVVTEANATVNAAAQSVQLTLVAMPERVAAGQEVAVTAGVSPALLADTTLMVKVFFGEASSQQVTLSDKVSSQEVSFPTSATGTLEVRAQAVAVEPADLVVAAAAQTQTVEVLPEDTVELTLDAPKSVTVGSTFPVTVRVGAGTPLPAGSSVSATVSFNAVNSEDIEVVLIPGAPSTAVILTAPRRSGILVVEVSGRAGEDSLAIRFVLDTSAQVSVEPLRVTLTLGGPDAVTVGETYQVMVGTDMTVPEGTMLVVTVSDGTVSQEVSLAADDSEEVSFTAPANVRQVTVTATATVQTDTDALEVAAPAAKAVTVQVQVEVLHLELQQGQPLTAGSPVILAVQLDRELPTTISYSVMALHTVSEMTTSVLTIHPADTTTQEVSFSGQQIASPGQWEFSILPAESPFEGVPTTVTISLDFIQPQGIINADDLLFALRYLVRCGSSAAGCRANGEDLASLARNLGNDLQIEQLPAALQLPDLSGGGEERPAANWFTLLLGLQGLPVELLFPTSKQEPSQLENAIRSMLSVQEEEE